MATDYGRAGNVVSDLERRSTLVSGARNVANAIARRLTTPHGSLTVINPEYGQDYGFDVRGLLNSRLTPVQRASAQSSIEAECLKDERVDSATAELNFDAAASTLELTIDGTLTDGTAFQLVLAVTAVSVEILRYSA